MIAFSDSSWQYFPYTGRSTGSYIIFYQCGPIDHGTHIPVLLYQSSTGSEYNKSCTAGMVLAHFRMVIHELLSKNPDIVLEEAPMIILDSKYTVCMAKNSKYTNHTRHIAGRVHFVRNGEK